MATYRYKNISGQPQVIVGVGEVGIDQVIEVNAEIINPNFQLLSDDDRLLGVDPVAKVKTKKS
jgi:hypothetical protein